MDVDAISRFGALFRFNLGKWRYSFRAPWHEPLFSERQTRPLFNVGGFRLTRARLMGEG